MEIRQTLIRKWPEDQAKLDELRDIDPQVLLVFGSVALMTPAWADALATAFPTALRLGCSTAGEILGTVVENGTITVTALRFGRTGFRQAQTRLPEMGASYEAGASLGQALCQDDLKGVLLFGIGLGINGTALVQGLTRHIPPGIPVVGGLAGDDGAFQRTWTLSNQGLACDQVVALGLYGEALHFLHGYYGGWQAFGPLRKVTRCEDNILFELDGKPALEIYKRYLGDYAQELPASGLLFPFEMLSNQQESSGVIRTILGIDEHAGSLILAGDIDPTGYLRLMHSQADALVDGAEQAAAIAIRHGTPQSTALAILVSCVGRKLVMGGRVDEEIEAVAATLGNTCRLTGFYSYGEISPSAIGEACRLHNQTMTLTVLSEDGP